MRALAMRTVCCLLLTTATLVGWCQSPPANALAPPRQITRAEEVLVPSELAGIFRMPPRCDAEGNIYIRKRNDGNEPILKINLKGERKALFQPPIAVGKLGITRDFAISAENEVYLIAYAGRERMIHVFASDGSYKRKITLDAPFLVSPDKLAVFPSGEVLVAGYKSNPKTPRTLFTGIFSSSGQLIKELALPDDAELRRLAEKGDRQLSDPAAPGINFAVSRGWAGAGADGNVYLMRWGSPALFYAISPAGKVVRRFAISAGKPGLMPAMVHVTGNRIAVFFRSNETKEKLIKVVDLEGEEVAEYIFEADRVGRPLGAGFSCYVPEGEQFVFIGTQEGKLALWIAYAR